jgi:hypothetical protein
MTCLLPRQARLGMVKNTPRVDLLMVPAPTQQAWEAALGIGGRRGGAGGA